MWEALSGLVAQGVGEANVAPFLAMLISGFALAAYGHAAKNRWLIGIGIAMILVAAILFQLEIRVASPQDLPPGV
jgi:hypothetical protein